MTTHKNKGKLKLEPKIQLPSINKIVGTSGVMYTNNYKKCFILSRLTFSSGEKVQFAHLMKELKM